MGHGIERENSKTAITNAEAAKAEPERLLNEASQTIENLQRDKPDIAGMQEQHNKAIEALKNENRKTLQKEQEKTRKFLMDRDLQKAFSFLKDRKVDPEIAKNLTFENASLAERI